MAPPDAVLATDPGFQGVGFNLCRFPRLISSVLWLLSLEEAVVIRARSESKQEPCDGSDLIRANGIVMGHLHRNQNQMMQLLQVEAYLCPSVCQQPLVWSLFYIEGDG